MKKQYQNTRLFIFTLLCLISETSVSMNRRVQQWNGINFPTLSEQDRATIKECFPVVAAAQKLKEQADDREFTPGPKIMCQAPAYRVSIPTSLVTSRTNSQTSRAKQPVFAMYDQSSDVDDDNASVSSDISSLTSSSSVSAHSNGNAFDSSGSVSCTQGLFPKIRIPVVLSDEKIDQVAHQIVQRYKDNGSTYKESLPEVAAKIRLIKKYSKNKSLQDAQNIEIQQRVMERLQQLRYQEQLVQALQRKEESDYQMLELLVSQNPWYFPSKSSKSEKQAEESSENYLIALHKYFGDN
jgi:ribosomal protein S10